MLRFRFEGCQADVPARLRYSLFLLRQPDWHAVILAFAWKRRQRDEFAISLAELL
jgi:hypothetical protein